MEYHRMKLATYVIAYNQGKWIMRNLENSYPYVDHIYVLYSKLPLTHNKKARETLRNEFDINIIKNSKYMDKITIIEGVWDTDTEMRNVALKKAKEDKIDYLMSHDADEYFFNGDFLKIRDAIKNNPDYIMYEIDHYVFWKSFKYRIIDINKEHGVAGRMQTIVNVNKVDNYDYIRDVYWGDHALIENVKCYHGSYVLTDEECYKKICSFGHAADFDIDKWYNEVWLKWTPKSRDFHPIWPWCWDHVEEFKGELPEVIRDLKCSNDLNLFTPLGLGDNIVCYGLIKELSKTYDKINYYIHPANYNNVVRLYESISNVEIVKGEVVNNRIITPDDITVIGWEDMETARIVNPDYHFDQYYYDMFNLPLELKWDNFYFKRDLKKEKDAFYNVIGLKDDEEYIIVYEDKNRDILLDKKYIPKNIKIINPVDYQEISMFDFIYTVEKAKEVHVFNTGFLSLLDLMNVKNDNLIYHRYVKSPYPREKECSQVSLKLNWKIIK